jgi:hypothetical protein
LAADHGSGLAILRSIPPCHRLLHLLGSPGIHALHHPRHACDRSGAVAAPGTLRAPSRRRRERHTAHAVFRRRREFWLAFKLRTRMQRRSRRRRLRPTAELAAHRSRRPGLAPGPTPSRREVEAARPVHNPVRLLTRAGRPAIYRVPRCVRHCPRRTIQSRRATTLLGRRPLAEGF